MNFNIAINRILGHEGGYVNNPNDPGGETNWGISKRSYPKLDIKNLTKEQAIAIYKKDYWDEISGDSLPNGVGFQVLDFAINSGIYTAVKSLQKVLGVQIDGVIGPITLKIINSFSPQILIMKILADRLDFMTKCSGWNSFSKGWSRRISENLKYGALDV